MLGCGLAYVRQVQVSAAETEEDGHRDWEEEVSPVWGPVKQESLSSEPVLSMGQIHFTSDRRTRK
jgi:hypothetical protein